MRYLIVNADDFGFSPTINEGVCEAHLRGVVTDASLLVRSPHAAHAVQLAHKANFPIGIHVDLVTAFVVPHSHALGPESNLVRELFRREFDHQPGHPISCELLLQIHAEIRAQIRKFSEMVGRLPTHLDYHFGLHYLPEVMAIYLIVAEEFQIPVRWGCQYAGSNPYPLSPSCLCDQFRGIATGGLDLFLSLVQKPWEGVMEMICHPGYFTPEGLPDSYNREREHELAVLTDPRLIAELKQEEIELVSYDWLKAHTPVQPQAKI